MNPDPPLTNEFLAAFLRECSWMRKSKDWKERLLYRLAKFALDTITQQALKGVDEAEKKWQGKVKK